jgi:hypothetical protein
MEEIIGKILKVMKFSPHKKSTVHSTAMRVNGTLCCEDRNVSYFTETLEMLYSHFTLSKYTWIISLEIEYLIGEITDE